MLLLFVNLKIQYISEYRQHQNLLNSALKRLKLSSSQSRRHDKILVEKVNFEIAVSLTKQNAKKDTTRFPKNLPHLNFEDERCKYSTLAKEQSLEIRQDSSQTKCGKRQYNLYNVQ